MIIRWMYFEYDSRSPAKTELLASCHGALEVQTTKLGHPTLIQGTTFTSCSAVDGGAIFMNEGSAATISDSNFTACAASKGGGASTAGGGVVGAGAVLLRSMRSTCTSKLPITESEARSPIDCTPTRRGPRCCVRGCLK